MALRASCSGTIYKIARAPVWTMHGSCWFYRLYSCFPHLHILSPNDIPAQSHAESRCQSRSTQSTTTFLNVALLGTSRRSAGVMRNVKERFFLNVTFDKKLHFDVNSEF